MEALLIAHAPTDPVAAAERRALDAAILFRLDEGCSSALADFEDAVDELLRLRRERRANQARAA